MFIHMPAGFIRILFHPVYNWKFMSAEEPNSQATGRSTRRAGERWAVRVP
jgi:hypothetical protein